MNYLARPVFPFTPDWSGAVQRNLDFDLRSTLLGFGAEYFTPTATYTVNGWDLELYLASAADVLAFEAFADSLVGRLNGFWLPCPLQAVQFAAAIDTQNFKIVSEGLADTWNDRPDQHLFFAFMDGTQVAGQIAGVVDNGDGTETVTLTAALASAPVAGTTITRLHYVRFANDEEQYDFDAENIARLKLTLLELPLEYAAAETGLQPVYLYHLWSDAPVNLHWRYTSFAAAVASAGNLFTPFAMNHAEIKHTVDGNSNPVSIEAKPDANHPFSMLAGAPPGRPLWIEIISVQYGAPDTQTKIFSGYVASVQDDGVKYTARCETRLAWLKTKLPRFLIGSMCNHTLFEPNTCKVLRALYEVTVAIQGFQAGLLPVVRVNFALPDIGAVTHAQMQADDWFTGGILETGVGVQYEIRSIIHSHWNGAQLELTLNMALRFAAIGSQMQITAGCDHTSLGPNGCKVKFNNFQNFGGFVAVPQRNLSLQAIQQNASTGNKK